MLCFHFHFIVSRTFQFSLLISYLIYWLFYSISTNLCIFQFSFCYWFLTILLLSEKMLCIIPFFFNIQRYNLWSDTNLSWGMSRVHVGQMCVVQFLLDRVPYVWDLVGLLFLLLFFINFKLFMVACKSSQFITIYETQILPFPSSFCITTRRNLCQSVCSSTVFSSQCNLSSFSIHQFHIFF